MRPFTLDPEALDAVAAAAGVDTIQALAELTGISAWILYNARKRGTIMPSHAKRIAEVLNVERERFIRSEVPA